MYRPRRSCARCCICICSNAVTRTRGAASSRSVSRSARPRSTGLPKLWRHSSRITPGPFATESAGRRFGKVEPAAEKGSRVPEQLVRATGEVLEEPFAAVGADGPLERGRVFGNTSPFASHLREDLEVELDAVGARPPAERLIRICRRRREQHRSLREVERVAVQGAVLLRSEEHTSELQSRGHLVCRLLLEKKKIRETQGQSCSN